MTLAHTARRGACAPEHPTWLLLHGFLGSGRNLASLARRWTELAPTQHLVLLDLPGHGTSPPLPIDGGSLERMAREVADTARALGMPELRVLGHSMGGQVALHLRALTPVARTVLLDISPSPTRGRGGALDRVLEALLAAPDRVASRHEMRAHFSAAGVSAALTEWLILNLTQVEGGFGWRIDRQRLQALHERTTVRDAWSLLSPPASDIWCIRGGASAFVDDTDVTRLEHLGARVTTLEGAGHFVHVDALDALAALLASGA